MNQVIIFYSYSLVQSQIIYRETHKTVIQHQRYLWNVIVLQFNQPTRRETIKPQTATVISLWF